MAPSMLRAAASIASTVKKSIPSLAPSMCMSNQQWHPVCSVAVQQSLDSKQLPNIKVQHQLLGYPQLHYQQQQQIPPEKPPPPVVNSATPPPPVVSNPSFMDLMEANFNNTTTTMNDHHNLGRTENLSPTFLSSGNPCVDFFYHIVPDTPPESLVQRLELAWKHDPLTTLKLVCNLRGLRGTGKADNEGFYASALWLHKNHPKTLAGNVKWFAKFGYFKDLPEILFRLLEGLDVRKKAEKEEIPMRRRMMTTNITTRRIGGRVVVDDDDDDDDEEEERRRRMRRRRRLINLGLADDDNDDDKEEERRRRRRRMNLGEVEKRKEKYIEQRKKALELRIERILEKGKKALERYYNDEDYRFLHDRISDLFAEYLISDLKLLNSGQVRKISLASKWCPNLGSSFDRATLLCESIARRVFPREKYPEYQGIEDAHYAYRVRDRLRKQCLVPLHQAIEIPEVYMSSNKWNSLPYNRVPSVAMRNYNCLFEKHDEERFNDYLEKVKSGTATIAAGTLLPHKIIQSLEHVSIDDDNKDKNDVAELQWRRMVKDLTKNGKLRDCLALCDVSGSMSGTPMEVCVALGLLVSEMSEDPWKGKVITFSADPQLHKIQGEDLYSKATFIKEMDWGYNTNFQKVFDLILQVAINGKLSEDQMIKRLFVFSDMEFDLASGSCSCSRKFNYQTGVYERVYSSSSWETDYEAIKRKYQESGYGNSVPQIVFWNLRDSRSTPVMGEQKGVALVSGFSKNLLTVFLDGMDSEKMTPEYVMEMAISGQEYQKLVLFANGLTSPTPDVLHFNL